MRSARAGDERPRRRRAQRGSAAIEVLAAVPLLATLAIVAWYLAAGLVAAMDANEALVPAGLEERGSVAGSASRAIEVDARVPSLAALPELRLTASARVRPR